MEPGPPCQPSQSAPEPTRSEDAVSAVLEMSPIAECTAAGCSYNDHPGCHAFAVTIGGSGSDASCSTFIPMSAKGGLSKETGHVSVYQRADCRHNESLECTATSVRIGAGSDTADCLTYSAA